MALFFHGSGHCGCLCNGFVLMANSNDLIYHPTGVFPMMMMSIDPSSMDIFVLKRFQQFDWIDLISAMAFKRKKERKKEKRRKERNWNESTRGWINGTSWIGEIHLRLSSTWFDCISIASVDWIESCREEPEGSEKGCPFELRCTECETRMLRYSDVWKQLVQFSSASATLEQLKHLK